MGGRNFGDFNLTGQFFILTRFSKMVYFQEKELYFSERVTPSQKFFSILLSWSSDSSIIMHSIQYFLQHVLGSCLLLSLCVGWVWKAGLRLFKYCKYVFKFKYIQIKENCYIYSYSYSSWSTQN